MSNLRFLLLALFFGLGFLAFLGTSLVYVAVVLYQAGWSVERIALLYLAAIIFALLGGGRK